MDYKITVHFKDINDKESFRCFIGEDKNFKYFIKDSFSFYYNSNFYDKKVKTIKINYNTEETPTVDIITI